jgi:hypothetical protein
MTDRPTHLHIPTGHAVFPGGYPPTDLVELPDNHWVEPDKQMKITTIKVEAAAQIEAINFSVTSQMNAIREGRHDDPRFAKIDAIRKWANDEETKLT